MRTLAVLACLFSSCSLTKDGKCQDYKPLNMCPQGTYYECARTAEGCEQCSCVGEDRRGLAPLPGQ